MILPRPDLQSRWTLAGFYFLAFTLMFWPAIDLLSNTWPPRMGFVEWRYGFAGLLGSFYLTPLFGYGLAVMIAVRQRHKTILRVAAVLGIAGVVAILAVMVVFPLDTLQIRASRAPGVLPAVLAGAAIAEVRHLTACLVLALLAFGSWGSARRIDAPPEEPEQPSTGIVMAR